MATKLNQKGFEHARRLIEKGQVILDDRDQWSDHQPSAQEENTFIKEQGFPAYAQWYLGVDEENSEDTKERYTFPYGDFQRVHRCAVLSAEVRAGQYKHHDIERAAAQLRDALDASKKQGRGTKARAET
jgi:hypothetical protein